jgi:protein TonB
MDIFKTKPIWRIIRESLILGTAIAMIAIGCSAQAGPVLKTGIQESSNYIDAEILACPHPEIPSELHEQCFKSCCIARFTIAEDGKHRVKLISSSGSNEVDDIAVSTLQQWKFKPAMLNGKPVESTRKIRVEFEVE